MTAFSRGDFGSGQRLSRSGFVVFGLLTFWVYSTLRFASALRMHFTRRWKELEPGLAAANAAPRALARLKSDGFNARVGISWTAAFLFAADAGLVIYWFIHWVVLANDIDYATALGVVGLSSAVFFAATVVTMVWALSTVRRHEVTELLIKEGGPAALLRGPTALSDDMANRWDHQANKTTLFLVCSVPIAFSPTIGVHLMITGALPGYELALPLLCFLLAGTFHVWGTMLLVDLFNDHLQSEARHSGAGSLRRMIAEDNVNSRTEEVQPERELLAIMLTDIFGYSKAMERDEKRTYTKLVEHNRLIRSAIGTYRGREIDTIGDAFLVTFHSALDAVDCALAVQRTFKDLNLGRESDDRLLVRIGIHLGDVLITGNRVYGDAVNVASRIESLAEPGGICVSEPVFEMVRKKVQLDVERIEGVQLKNIEVAPRLYRIKLPD